MWFWHRMGSLDIIKQKCICDCYVFVLERRRLSDFEIAKTLKFKWDKKSLRWSYFMWNSWCKEVF